MSDLRKLIDNLLQSEDIEGLISIGAPSDEYIHEAGIIYNQILKIPEQERTHKSVLSIIVIVWKNSFGLSDEEVKLRIPYINRVIYKLGYL